MSLAAQKSKGANEHQALLADGRIVEDTPWQHAGQETDQAPPLGVWVCQLKEARAVGMRPRRIATAVLVLLAITALGLPGGRATLVLSGVIAAVSGLMWVMLSRARTMGRVLGARASWLYLGEAFAGEGGVESTNEMVREALRRGGIQVEREHSSDPAEGFEGGAWHLKGNSVIFNESAGRAGFRRLVVSSVVAPDWTTIGRAKGAILGALEGRAKGPAP